MAVLNGAINDATGNPRPKLFSPLKLGKLDLKHRIIMAPLTRLRSPEHIPGESVAEYYEQRSSDGGLLISEGTHISVMGGNYHDAPGIFSPEHVRAWEKVTNAVHRKGGFIYCQLWHVGRTAHPLGLGGRPPLAPSAVKFDGKCPFTREGPKDNVTPKEMTIQDIKDTISDYTHAAKCAISAGFDGVEIHAANGYLLDQFICDNINVRTDTYGGSTENRSRLVLEVIDEVTAAIGASRVGIRFSPFGLFQGTNTSDIFEHYGHVVSKLDNKGLSYVHLIEPRSDLLLRESAKIARLTAIAKTKNVSDDNVADYTSLKAFRMLLKTTPLIVAGGYNDTNASAPIDSDQAEAVVIGRYFISNPDIVERMRNGWPLAPYDRSTFYVPGDQGYTDYPTY